MSLRPFGAGQQLPLVEQAHLAANSAANTPPPPPLQPSLQRPRAAHPARSTCAIATQDDCDATTVAPAAARHQQARPRQYTGCDDKSNFAGERKRKVVQRWRHQSTRQNRQAQSHPRQRSRQQANNNNSINSNKCDVQLVVVHVVRVRFDIVRGDEQRVQFIVR